MLTSGMQEGRPDVVIEVVDLDPVGVQAIVNYAYFHSTAVDADALVPAFIAARKYAVLPLQDACIHALKTSNVETALALLEVAVCTGDDDLKAACAACRSFDLDSIARVLGSSAFTRLSEVGLKELVSWKNCATLTSEALWEACKQWACATVDDDLPRDLSKIAPLLPTYGLPCVYLAELNAKGLISAAQMSTALGSIHVEMGLIGSWKSHNPESRISSLTIEVDDDGHLKLCSLVDMPVFHKVNFSLKFEDGWHLVNIGRFMGKSSLRVKRADQELLVQIGSTVAAGGWGLAMSFSRLEQIVMG